MLTPSRIYGLKDPIKRAKAKKLGKISVRMVKITLSTGEIEYLVTNIDKFTMCTKEFGYLYYKRWGNVIKLRIHKMEDEIF